MRIFADLPPEIEQELFRIAQYGMIRIVARVDQYFPEERGTDQAVVALGDRIREQLQRPVAGERHDQVVERIPLHIRLERGHVMKERALHVRDPAVLRDLVVVFGTNLRGSGFIIGHG